MNTQKLQTFEKGLYRPSQRDKQKKEEDAKRRKAQEEAAAVIEEFVKEFQDDNATSGQMHSSSIPFKQTWIRGGVAQNASQNISQRQDQYREERVGREYRPKRRWDETDPDAEDYTALQALDKSSSSTSSTMPRISSSEQDATQREPVFHSGVHAKKKRQLDTFLEEIKARQEHHHPSHGSARTDSSIHDVNEELLLNTFAHHGPIASVKIMWPRTQEQFERQRNDGFIAFMNRADAEDCFRSCDGLDLMGMNIKFSWGKAVIIPDKPIFEIPEHLRRPRSSTFSKPTRSSRTHQEKSNKSKPEEPIFPVSLPSFEQRLVIHRTIERVIKYGPPFEASLVSRMQRLSNDNEEKRMLSFIWDQNDPSHHYYRWKLYSLLQGDSIDEWRVEPVKIFEEFPTYKPPEWSVGVEKDNPDAESDPESEDADLYQHDRDEHYHDDESDSDSETKEEDNGYPRLNRPRLMHMIRTLNLTRGRIGRLMTFAILNAKYQIPIITILVDSIINPLTTPFPTKLARVYALSDILANAGSGPTRGSWKYRELIKSRLKEVFAHLGFVWGSINGRLRAEQWRLRVMKIVEAWESNGVLTNWECDEVRKWFESGKVTKEEDKVSDPAVGDKPADATTTAQSGIVSTTSSGSGTPVSGAIDVQALKRNVLEKLKSMRQESDTSRSSSTAEESQPKNNNDAVTPHEEEDVDGVPLDIEYLRKMCPNNPIFIPDETLDINVDSTTVETNTSSGFKEIPLESNSTDTNMGTTIASEQTGFSVVSPMEEQKKPIAFSLSLGGSKSNSTAGKSNKLSLGFGLGSNKPKPKARGNLFADD